MSIRHVADTHGTEAASRVAKEIRKQFDDLGLITTKTHVIVGDHAPEPRNREITAVYPQSTPEIGAFKS